MGAFPARALLVPLAGRLRVVTPLGVSEPSPPEWDEAGGASGAPEIRPLDAPVAIPLGDAHSVHTLGPDPSLWAYVFYTRDDLAIT